MDCYEGALARVDPGRTRGEGGRLLADDLLQPYPCGWRLADRAVVRGNGPNESWQGCLVEPRPGWDLWLDPFSEVLGGRRLAHFTPISAATTSGGAGSKGRPSTSSIATVTTPGTPQDSNGGAAGAVTDDVTPSLCRTARGSVGATTWRRSLEVWRQGLGELGYSTRIRPQTSTRLLGTPAARQTLREEQGLRVVFDSKERPILAAIARRAAGAARASNLG